MTGASWAVSCAGVVMWAACRLALQHYHHLHQVAHPIAIRAAIFFSYVAGCAVAVTALGGYVLYVLAWMLTVVGGVQSVTGHATVEVTGLILFVTAAIALIWAPRTHYAYLAAAVPFVLALSGGHEHAMLSLVPAADWVTRVSHWIGG